MGTTASGVRVLCGIFQTMENQLVTNRASTRPTLASKRLQGGHERTEPRGEGRGTIATGNSDFDVAFAGDLWSDEDKPSPSYETVLESSQRTEGPQERIPVVHQPDQTNGRAELVQGESPSPSTPRPVGRSKGSKRASSSTRPTFATPEGTELQVDPRRSGEDAGEQSRHSGKNVTSNRLGGGDLRVLRENMEELGARSAGSGSKRPSSDAPGASSSTYANNKRTRVRKRVETDQLDDKHSHVGGDTLSMLVFLREVTERRTEAENRHRREDREERLAHERLKREEREQVRREEAAAAQQLREDLTRREAAAAVEKNTAVALQLPWPAVLATVCQMMR
ncbi:hypothetical protein PC113_g12855 [Phytophthora cactorum]|uniref:Uncharacterized protein n=1 Tax=Phytophthora cactorum TaxID=29920 RepID=A0A8T0YYX4_9STRA|nr:hypothetical protein PC113_g12855 [Phytophthora cactorum]